MRAHHRYQLTLAGAATAVTLSSWISAQTPTPRAKDSDTNRIATPAQTGNTGRTVAPAHTGNTSGPSNPLLDMLKSSGATLTPATPREMHDYRVEMDPQRQRLSAFNEEPLPLFGYSYFESSRRVIDARRAYLRAIFSSAIRPQSTTKTTDRTGVARKVLRTPTQQEMDDVAALTDAQRLDLLDRHARQQTTPEEEVRYALFLTPGTWDMFRPVTPEEQKAYDSLTDAQKAELLAKRRDGMLTESERTANRVLFMKYPDAGSDASNQGTAPELMDTGVGATRSSSPSLDTRASGLQTTGRSSGTENTETSAAPRSTGGARAIEGGAGRTTGAEGGATGAAGSASDRVSLRPRSTRTARGTAGQEEGGAEELFAVRSDGGVPTWESPVLPSVDAYRQVADPLAGILQTVVASAPASYQLGPGDMLTLRFWSPTVDATDNNIQVDTSGSVSLPGGARVSVAGRTITEAEAAIRARMVRSYRAVNIALMLRELRTMQVTVSGEAYYPGTYMVPAVATALNLIYATGGPTENGSLRRIEIRRGGKLVSTVDMYRFLLTGDKAGDEQLRSGDVIFFPGRDTTVSVSGEVKRPASFELLPSETLADAVRYAGGIKASGVAQRVQVTTLQPGSARVTRDVDASAASESRQVALYDGDTVEVFSVRPELANKVTVEGAVDQPGEYAWTDGMRVADLIKRARGPLSEAFTTRADLYRVNPDQTLALVPVDLQKAMDGDPSANLALNRWDLLKIYTRGEVTWTARREVTVRGAVAKEGIYYRSDNMRIKDLLLQAGGTLPDAHMEHAALLHQRPDGSYAYDHIDLAQALKDDAAANVLLQDRDVLAIYHANEARFTPDHTASVLGEVVAPGVYPRGEKMRLTDLLKLAGGTTAAASDVVQIAHSRVDNTVVPTSVRYDMASGVATPDPDILDGDVVTIQGRGTYQAKPFVVTISGAVKRPGPVVLRGDKSRLSDAIREAGGLKDDAYPQGVEFLRDPALLATAGQKQTAVVISKLSDLLNDAEYRRELAKSDIERAKALGAAARSQAQIPIAGLTTSTTDTSAGTAISAAAGSLFQRDLVSTPRSLMQSDVEPNSNVAINLQKALERPGGDDDILMVDGDKVVVPQEPTTVEVVGAVVQSRAVLYRKGANLDSYIAQAGGLAPDAAVDRAIVIRVGGGLLPVKKAHSFEPGDVIIVPTRVLAERLSNRSSDFDNIIRSLTSSALIVLAAKKLLGI